MLIDATTIRYGIAGVLVLTIDYLILNILLFAGAELLTATSTSFLTGGALGYIFHSIWTFKYDAKGKHAMKFSQFLLVGGVGLVITNSIMYACTELLQMNHNIAKTIAVAASALWAYSASRWWIFRKNRQDNPLPNRHILIVSPYYPPHIGGLENHAAEFNAHMANSGWNITVWTANIPKAAPYEKIAEQNIEVYRYDAIEIIPGFPMPAIWKKSFWKQWKTIHKKGTYSHVLSRTRFFLSSLLAHAIARSIHVPHIHVEHGSYYVSQKSPIINAIAYIYDTTLGKLVLKQADIVIANSQATALFVSSMTNKKVSPYVIHRGVELQNIESIPPANEKITKPEKVVIAFAGRLMSGKGVADLLYAISQCETKEHIICWIIGDGPEKASLEATAQHLKIRHIVHFLGARKHEETISLIKASDVIVNTSYTEGLPTAIIEAALCEKAIIATNVGGTPEIIEHNVSGILIEPKDVVALTRAIDIVVRHPHMRTNLGKQAKRSAQLQFLWEKAIEKYEKILLSPEN